jgi:predicted anti-sigma-YlaC factor YlaD
MDADMLYEDPHVPDQDLLLAADGELPPRREAQVRAHLAACWDCRSRMAEMEATIADFVQVHRRSLDPQLPPASGPRALLRARLAEASAVARPSGWRGGSRFVWGRPPLAYAGAAIAVVILGVVLLPWRQGAGSPFTRFQPPTVPDGRITPGATIPVTKDEICAAGGTDRAPAVPRTVALTVFRAYGISRPGRRVYELDYLITPELGGADDVRNLWPQPYAAGVWNAHVKDALENRLHELVCRGDLDLATAQQDLARDWIAAYKKYFHTDRPLMRHSTFAKDQPWE